MALRKSSVVAVTLVVGVFSSAAFASKIEECRDALSGEPQVVESLASVETQYTPQQRLDAGVRVRAAFRGSRMFKDELVALDERVAVAEQNFFHRDLENNFSAVRALERFAAGEIERTAPELAQLQSVIDEAVAASRDSGVLSRLALEEEAYLSGDQYTTFDVYGAAPQPLLQKIAHKLRATFLTNKAKQKGQPQPAIPKFVRAESFARELRKLPSDARLRRLRDALREASPALLWPEVVVLLSAFEQTQRLAAYEILEVRTFLPMETFPSVQAELKALEPQIFSGQSPYQRRGNTRFVLGAAAALALGVGGFHGYDYYSVRSRQLSDGTTLAQKIAQVEELKDPQSRLAMLNALVSPTLLQELTVPEVLALAEPLCPSRMRSLWAYEMVPYDNFLVEYVKANPRLSIRDLATLSDAALDDRTHDAILKLRR